ncbi:hypothetical protein FNU76_02965 [Chitinimonas arctica]|uniref:DNA topoisomerase IB n=1 Tax=Chitinimonas arctica TaxID=2594795 RepID=A0A516SBF7_9NEIS|nr:hypothetical protein [Chitinimonas arctica]QDQ25398.1 hypothetical protein FNU76_02965 [Chitinimonas arctica]
MTEVANQLGNTVAVCRRCYVHPAVLAAHLAGDLSEYLAAIDDTASSASGLRADEVATLAVLRAMRKKGRRAVSG